MPPINPANPPNQITEDTAAIPVYITRGPATTVAGLPPAATNNGNSAMVTDSSVALTGNYGNIVVGGGIYTAPVYCDGVHWRLG